MSGLKAIILFNSYLKGLKARIPCDGHTNLGGNNGTGKTSALRLLPIFFGQEPGKVMDRSGNKSNFVDYYLPNYQSMVIFEYERLSGETCCAVLYRPGAGSQHGHAYRFVLGSADETIFHPDLGDHYTRQDEAWSILRHGLKDIGVTISQQVNYTSNYRDIISNTTHTSRRQKGSAQTRSFREESRRFCLGGLDDHIQHMHELTSVTLESSHLISRLKSMIIDTQIRDRVHLPDARSNTQNPSTWRDIASLRSFEEARPDLMSGIETYNQLMGARQELASYLTALQGHLVTVNDEIDSKTAELSQNKRDEGIKDEEFLAHSRQANDQLTTLRSEQDGLKRDIEALYDELTVWEEKGMDEIAIRYRNLPELRQQLTAYRHVLEALKQQGQEIEASYNNDRANAIERHSRRLDPLRKTREALVESLHCLQRRHDDVIQALRDQWEGEERAVITEIEQEIDRLRGQHERLIEQQAVVREPTAEEKAARELSQRSIQHAERERDVATQEYQACQSTIQQTSEALGAKERQLDKAQRAMDDAEADHEALHKSRYAEPGTLLAYLRDHYPGWGDSLGKVISPTLLQRKDLRPEMVSEDPTLYGLSLDLVALSKPDEAMEAEQLERLLTDAKQIVKQHQSAVASLADEVKKIRSTLGQENNQLTVLGKRQMSLKETIKDLKAADQDLKTAQRIEATRRQEAIKAHADQIMSKIREAGTMKKARCAELQREAKAAVINLKGEQSGEVALKEHEIAQKDQLIKGAQTTHLTYLKALDTSLNEALNEKGIDTKARDKAAKDVDDAMGEIDALEAQKDDVARYEHWRKYHFPTAEAKNETLRRVERDIAAREKAFSDLKADFEADMQRLKETRVGLNHDIQQLNTRDRDWQVLIDHAHQALSRIPAHDQNPPTTRADQLGDGDQVAHQLNKRQQEIKTQTQSLVNISGRCREIINDHPNTQVSQAWHHMYRRLIENNDQDSHSDALAIASMHALSDLMNDRLPEIERVLIQAVRAIADRMVKYHGNLKNLNNAVNRVSRELKTKLNTEHNFEAISDIQVQLVSLVGDDEQWKPLTSFAEQWKQWLIHQEGGLPSATLLSDLRQLDEAYRNGRGGSSEVDDLIDIEIQLRENERTVPIRSDKDFADASSAGLSMMAVLIIFSALTRYLCPNEEIAITWPIDELGKIDPENIQRLFAMMQKRNINIFCAQPKASPETLRRFDNKMMLDKGKGVLTVEDKASKTLNPRFADAITAMEASA